MICCVDCFKDKEIKAAIEIANRSGDCPICGKTNTWIYNSDLDKDESFFEDMLGDIIEIYVPESELPHTYPSEDKKPIAERLCEDWSIFSGTPSDVFNINRFHNDYINLELLREILRIAKISIPAGECFYRARVSNEKGKAGFKRKEMWAPPDDIASPGRANSKGQSCLYLSNRKKTTVKEIRAHAFDYVTIATFKLNREINVLDLCSITHNSPFYANTDKVDFLINEQILHAIERDLAKPMSRWDSELDYLPTQYISDFAKFCGYDGVRYYSTFDKDAYNIALFNSNVCSCIYHRNFLIGDLDYKLSGLQ